MVAKAILNIGKPITQSVKAVCGLLSWKGRSSNPLPEYVEMGEGENRLVLVLSNKKDAYYTTTARDCSCPAHTWHPGHACKHMRKYFPETAKPAATVTETGSIRPTGKWPGGMNGPVDECRGVA